MRTFLLSLSLSGIFFTSAAQISPVKVTTTVIASNNNASQISIQLIASKGVKIIGTTPIPNLPVNTTLMWDSSTATHIKHTLQASGNNKVLKGEGYTQYNIAGYDTLVLTQIIANITDTLRAKGILNYNYQDTDGGIKSEEITISKQIIKSESNKSTHLSNSTKNYAYNSLWAIFIAGLGAGLIAFATPCVYALVPVTVSMFLKKSKTPAEGKRNVFFYAICITLIYTLVGLLTGPVLGNNFMNWLSTHWVFNLAIFILFVIFGLSFLGAYDINLPNSWANKMDSKANTKSYAGIFFMALTLVIVSFSCTGIFVASLTTTALQLFGTKGPIVGMFAFGLGLAAPFMLLGAYPKLLTALTKSGGWQNNLKVTLGFLELALALKFLSNVDLDRQWGLLNRDVFLVLWIVLFGLLGLYLLGKLTFKHDSELPKNDFELPYISVTKLMLAITSFAFALYLVPGLWGAPLQAVSAFTPPMGTQAFVLNSASANAFTESNITKSEAQAMPPNKHVAKLKRLEPLAAIQNKLTLYYDYNEALAAAKALNKPLMLDFTGIQCVNCRKFEAAIWANKNVASSMKNDFIIASLYTDYNEELNDAEKKYSPLLKSNMETVGDYNEDLQLSLINTAAQPNYVFVSPTGKLLFPTGYGYEPSENATAFYEHLQKIKSAFAASQ